MDKEKILDILVKHHKMCRFFERSNDVKIILLSIALECGIFDEYVDKSYYSED